MKKGETGGLSIPEGGAEAVGESRSDSRSKVLGGVRRTSELTRVKDWLLGEKRDTSSTAMVMIGGKGRRQQESGVPIPFLLS